MSSETSYISDWRKDHYIIVLVAFIINIIVIIATIIALWYLFGSENYDESILNCCVIIIVVVTLFNISINLVQEKACSYYQSQLVEIH